jgi:hypothetical protein
MRELFQSVVLQAIPWGLGERHATSDALMDRYREVHEVRIAGSGMGWGTYGAELYCTVQYLDGSFCVSIDETWVLCWNKRVV